MFTVPEPFFVSVPDEPPPPQATRDNEAISIRTRGTARSIVMALHPIRRRPAPARIFPPATLLGPTTRASHEIRTMRAELRIRNPHPAAATHFVPTTWGARLR